LRVKSPIHLIGEAQSTIERIGRSANAAIDEKGADSMFAAFLAPAGEHGMGYAQMEH
jgi:hypothetical protein